MAPKIVKEIPVLIGYPTAEAVERIQNGELVSVGCCCPVDVISVVEYDDGSRRFRLANGRFHSTKV